MGGQNESVDVGADFGVMESIKALLRAIEGSVAAGDKRVKLKIRPGWDLEVVRAARTSFPEVVLHVDANSAYRLNDIGLFKDLDDLNLTMIEQPLAQDDILDHAKLQK
jgi:O-succinylbenzoate synthase